jgi:hypothetical protein
MKTTSATASASSNHGIGPFVLLACLGLGCSDSTLNAAGSADSAVGGQGGSSSLAGAPGSGGAASGGGGSGGKLGVGGSNTGGVPAGGAGGTGGIVCGPCPALSCPNGYLLDPSDPCGCSVCAPSDAGPVNDVGQSAKDATDACLALPCAYPICPTGYTVTTPPCGCPSCVPGDGGTEGLDQRARDAGKDAPADDAGQPDGAICPPIACIALACPNGTMPNPADRCGCPVCRPFDAGVDTAKLACLNMDECTCASANGCSVISNACYCPYPQCSPGGACVCGGGKFLGCAPVTLSTCLAAKDRIAGLCPTLSGATFDGLCQQSDSACITKCLNDVTTCSDVLCTFCETCDCATDAFSVCRAKCRSLLTQ